MARDRGKANVSLDNVINCVIVELLRQNGGAAGREQGAIRRRYELRKRKCQ
jgi:hypothetical protein